MILNIQKYLDIKLMNYNFKYEVEDSNGSNYEADMYIHEVDITVIDHCIFLNLEATGSYSKGDEEISLELKVEDELGFIGLQLEVEELDWEEA